MSWAATELVYTTKSDSSRQSFMVFLRRPNLWKAQGTHDALDLEEVRAFVYSTFLTCSSWSQD